MKCQDRLYNQLSSHLGQIALARRHTLESTDPEGLHDLRVAMRGLRVVLSILGKQAAELRTQWRIMANATGPTRDLEVLLALIDTLPHTHDLATLRARLAKEEQVARATLMQLLSASAMPRLLQCSRRKLGHIMQQISGRTLRRRAEKRARRFSGIIEQKMEQLNEQSPAQAWHEFRLDIKRLRYLIEHCGTCLPEHWQTLHPLLKRSQTTLGELHDLDLLIGISAHELNQERQSRLSAAYHATAALKDKL